MRRVYGIDIDAAVRDRTERPTVLCDLIEHLPPDSALWHAIDPDSLWTLADVLLAHIADLTAVANWHRGGSKGPPPQRIQRPGVKPDSTKVTGRLMTIEEAQEWLGW